MQKIEKSADTSVEIHPLLAERWSPRAFSPEVPPMEELRSLFEAARWAPSSSNNQPWSFFLGINGENAVWQQVFDCLDEGNQRWCKDAPVLVLAAGNTLTKRGNPNGWYQHDVGQAMSHITFQAMSLNLYVHQMAGFDKEIATEKFQLPENVVPVTCAAIGYMGNADELPEDLEKRERAPRERKALNEVVFSEKYGESFNF